MQIFILDENIELNCKFYGDKHVVKILTECCQILSTVYRKHNNFVPEFIYKSTHEKHPCVIWTGENQSNFEYTLKMAHALYNEYQYRYKKPDKHIRNKLIIDFLQDKKFLKEEKQTKFFQAMPEKYRQENTVFAYREYYIKEKNHLFKWTKRDKPYWIL